MLFIDFLVSLWINHSKVIATLAANLQKPFDRKARYCPAKRAAAEYVYLN